MKDIDWSKVDAPKERKFAEKPQPGGYVCKIVGVADYKKEEYLKIRIDIADGPCEGYYQGCFDSFGKWPNGGVTIRSYSDNSIQFFKGFVTALEESNRGFKWDSGVNKNPRSIEGLVVGCLFGEEQYKASDGTVKTSLKVRSTCSVRRIEDGDYTVPKLKGLDGKVVKSSSVPAARVEDPLMEVATMLEDDDDELPF